MTVTFLGLFFLLEAVLDFAGNPIILPMQYRKADYHKELQRGEVLPNCILGVGFVILGLGDFFFGWEEQNTLLYCLAVLALGIVSFYLIMKNRMKYRGK